MRPFGYARATTIDEAVAAAAEPGTAVLAGGTELLNWMRLGVAAPDRVVDISRAADLARIESLPGGGLRIGACARLNDVAADPRVRSDWPVLREAIHKAASAQLRNLATIGGNLLQKTRCAYFRSEEEAVPCNRRQPGSGCAALQGRSDRHALFGWTEDCVATHPADPAVALAALDADVVTRSADGARRIAARELHVLPQDRVDVDTVLAPGELIEALELAAPAPRSAYVKVRERESYEYALVSAAAAVELADDGTMGRARIALGSVALRPWRLELAEQRLAGLAPDDPAVAVALEAAVAQSRPAAPELIQADPGPQRGSSGGSESGGNPTVSASPPTPRFGAPLPRQDGVVKVTGAAHYAANHRSPGMLYGTLVGAPVPAGRVRKIETGPARALPGVSHVLTFEDFPALGAPPVPPASSARLPLQDDEIRYQGEPIALVLAQSLEQAEYAATLVAADVEAADFIAHPRGDRDDAAVPRQSAYLFFGFSDFEHGDVDAALASAEVRQEATYVQPSRHHNPMEPSATLAEWRDGTLTIVDSVQHVYGVRTVMAAVFDVAPEQVRVRSPHTGGGFGCKGFVWPHQILAAAAASVVDHPVRIVLTRAQMYSIVTYQPQIVQTVALAARPDGRLSAIDHESVNVTSVSDDFVEYATEASRTTYASPAIRARQRVQRANVNLPNPMRAPVEGCGLWALGSAINELADRLRMDPVQLRLANYAETHPVSGQPWSSKKLRECYEDGARAFGWRGRPSEPERDGPWLVGEGMADCGMGCFRNPSQAHVRLRGDGRAVIESGFQDIGTGTLTIFPQIVGEVLGLEPGLVSCVMGDTELPEAGPTYGSSSTMGVGAAVMAAAQDVLAKLGERAGRELPPAPGPGALVAAMSAAGIDEMVGEGSFSPEQEGPHALHTFGAIFVAVGVDPELGLVRLRRVVARYSVGRIVNQRTARAQMTGGIIWGWGKATMEVSHHDAQLGRWVSKNLAGVAVPVSADIPSNIDVAFIEEVDEHASPIGGKGIGELGATGVDAAVADAVFHATGRRIRDLPITPEKLI